MLQAKADADAELHPVAPMKPVCWRLSCCQRDNSFGQFSQFRTFLQNWAQIDAETADWAKVQLAQ